MGYLIVEIVIALFAFAAVFLLAYNFFNITRYVKDRVKKGIASYNVGMEKLVKDSIVDIKSSEILRMQVAMILLSIVLGLAADSVWLPFVLLPFVFLAPKYYVKMKLKKYEDEYRENLPEFIETVTSSIRAGMSVMNAIKNFADSNDTAVGLEMKNLLSRVEIGLSIQGALVELGERVKVNENELLVTALTTVMESGGNISEVLGGILNSLRKKDEIDREMKALTSQGVLSGIIVGSLPVLLLIVMYMFDRELVAPLFNTKLGIAMLAVGVVMEALGAFFISKVVRIQE